MMRGGGAVGSSLPERYAIGEARNSARCSSLLKTKYFSANCERR